MFQFCKGNFLSVFKCAYACSCLNQKVTQVHKEWTQTQSFSNCCKDKTRYAKQTHMITQQIPFFHFPLSPAHFSTTGRRFTLCWSAIMRPAHISLIIRYQSSVSVFKLASNASFLPWTRSFRPGIRRSKKGAEDTFTSCRKRHGDQMALYAEDSYYKFVFHML